MVFFFFKSKCKTSKRLFEKKRIDRDHFSLFVFWFNKIIKSKTKTSFAKEKKSFSIMNLIRLFCIKEIRNRSRSFFFIRVLALQNQTKIKIKMKFAKEKRNLKKITGIDFFGKKNRSWSVLFFGVLVLQNHKLQNEYGVCKMIKKSLTIKNFNRLFCKQENRNWSSSFL